MKLTDKNRLFITNPELCREWDYEKNYPLRPEDISCGSNKKVWWKCDIGHQWKTGISKRTKRNFSCPYCKNRKASMENCLATIAPLSLQYWDYDKNRNTPYDITERSYFMVWWKCDRGHKWKGQVRRFSKAKEKCPYCANRIVSKENCLAVINPSLASEWHPTKNKETTAYNVLPHSSKKVWWKCKNDHEWQAKINNRMGHNNKKGMGCPYCCGKKSSKKNNIGNNLFLLSQWNWQKNKTLPKDYTFCSSKKVWWKCKKGHEWKSKISDRARGNN
jgi:hypothetical protein